MAISDRADVKCAWTDVKFSASGGSSSITAQVNFYPVLDERSSPAHLWEIRRFIEALGCKNVEGIYKITKVHLDAWKIEARIGGLVWSDNYRPSTKSLATLKQDLSNSSPEFEVSTALMLLIMVRTISSTYSAARSSTAASFTTCFLQRLITSQHGAEFFVGRRLDDSLLQLCDTNAAPDGHCCHIARVKEFIETLAGRPFIRKLYCQDTSKDAQLCE